MITRRNFLLALAAAPRPKVMETPGEKISFGHGTALLFEYRLAGARPKTYVHPLCAPDGRPLTLDSPADHVHHRGLMLAWSNVNGYDFWGETNPAPHGQIVHERLLRRRTSPPEVTVANRWVADGRLLLWERRTLRAPEPAGDAVWLEWESELEAVSEPVVISAEKHVYNGLGIRFIREMDRGRVLNSAGATVIKQADGQEAEWCAYGAEVEGQTYGVAIFNSPRNPRHPTPFFVMSEPFGYLSAAPTYREPFRLELRQRLRLHWAVVAFLGAADTSRLNDWYRRWSARVRRV